ncbi:hypothetical protein GGR42_003354 [Saonia flava]|uniref:DUF3108 domain-containing protein n=1 Tax=Saonia flava TaxID=523696 RepID=A0A846QVA1_9FLAO|nr:hypothetical protein [Saonia flava]NJB72856.1 hypothetical protein [Saonia flava]
MKIRITLLVFGLLFSFGVKSQDNCSTYYPLVEGATFQYTNYGKKGKEEGKINYAVTNVSSNGFETKATMNMNLMDEKGKEIYTTDYGFTCSDNIVKIDYHSLISEQTLTQFKDMEMEVTGTDIELPNSLGVDQELEDANVAIKIDMGGINMNMNIDTVNRKVEKKESVTTPAGTFDCYVIYSENKTKMTMMNKTFPNRVWLAEGVGMVKQESYNQNGKLMSSSVLTQFSK